MSYDRTKVDITEEKHTAAEALDTVIDALRDGIQVTDISVLGDGRKVFDFIKGTEDPIEKGAVAERLIALGFALVRDNVDINLA